jgi:hypothetical protein
VFGMRPEPVLANDRFSARKMNAFTKRRVSYRTSR